MKAYAKSILAGLSAFIGSLVLALGDNIISTQEWLTALGAGLAALGIVYAVPNKPQNGV